MSFSDMDRLEATYTKSSVKGIEQEPVKKNKIWELEYSEPKDDTERLIVARVLVREKAGNRVWDALAIVMAILAAVYGWIEGVGGTVIFTAILGVVAFFETISFISKRSLKKSVMFTRVIAIDRRQQSHFRNNVYYMTYHLTVKQEETNMYAEVEVSEDMYKEYASNKTVYLVKFGKRNVFAIYEYIESNIYMERNKDEIF